MEWNSAYLVHVITRVHRWCSNALNMRNDEAVGLLPSPGSSYTEGELEP